MNRTTRHLKLRKLCLLVFLNIFFPIKILCVSPNAVNLFELPGPLFSFGQFIVPKGWTYVTGIIYSLKGPYLEETSLWAPRFTHGLRDDLALTIYLPIALKFQEFNCKTSGFQDFAIRLEYQLFKKEIEEAKIRMTVLGTLYLPTGLPQTIPETGFGSPSYFMGTTMAYLSEHWYLFGAGFGHIMTKNANNSKFGNRVYYESGIGRNFYFIPKTLVALLFEVSGIFEQKDLICGAIDTNSGTNTIFCGPTVLIGNQDWFVQGGVVFPVLQQLDGIQPKASFFWGFYAGMRV